MTLPQDQLGGGAGRQGLIEWEGGRARVRKAGSRYTSASRLGKLLLVQRVPLLLTSQFALTVALGPQDVGRGYLAVLTIFTILEFFIAVIATHFGCQATRAQSNAVSTLTPRPEPLTGTCSLRRNCSSSSPLLPLLV